MASEDTNHHPDGLSLHNESPSEASPAGSKRRRNTGSTSSRGVANLTPEQLARKRANDREAQRAIRERTKAQIERLNQRIQELESSQPYHDLQTILRQKDAVLAENEDIRKRLASVISTIQPILNASGGLNELAAAAERSPLPVRPAHEAAASHAGDARTFHSNLAQLQEATAPPHQSSHPTLHSPADPGPGRQWQFPGDAPTSHVRQWQGTASTQYEHPRPAIHGEVTLDERLGVEYILDSGQRSMTDGIGHPQPPSSALSGQQAPPMTHYTVMPLNVPPTCTLDKVMLGFLTEQQARASSGVSMDVLVGPMYPNFTALVYPDRQIDSHPLSKLMVHIVRTFPDISGLPEQVAIVYIMFLVMRWQIDPSQANYDRLPEWMTPRASQLFSKHPYWMDQIPWPRLRDIATTQQPFTPLESFFVPYTTTVSLNWPYPARECLILLPGYQAAAPAESPAPPTPGASTGQASVGPGSTKEEETWVINPVFESHLRDLKNWSLGPSFRNAFPAFADAVRINEDGR